MVLFKHIAGKKSSIFTKVLKCHLYAQNEFEVRRLTSRVTRLTNGLRGINDQNILLTTTAESCSKFSKQLLTRPTSHL